MLSCRDVHALVTRAQDERLPWRVQLGMRFHLMMCGACRNFERQMAFLRDAMRQWRGRWQDPPEDGR